MKFKNIKLLIILLIAITCTGCTVSSNNGTYHEECYYNEAGEEFCVKKYDPPEKDEDPYVRY